MRRENQNPDILPTQVGFSTEQSTLVLPRWSSVCFVVDAVANALVLVYATLY
jgi:hypothetical protein